MRVFWRASRATIARTTCFARLSRRSSTFAIRWCGWRGRSIGTFWRDASARCVGWDPGSRRCRRGWWPGCSFSSICTTSPTRRCASDGWRTRISSTSVGKWCSGTSCHLIARRSRAGASGWVRSRSSRCCRRASRWPHRTGAINTKDLERVAIDTTVQEKAIAHPTDARLTHRAIAKLVELAKREGVELRQSYLRVAKRTAIMVGRYTHAHQFKRARRELKFLRTRLGRIIRDVRRKIEDDAARQDRFGPLLDLALRVRHQEQRQRGPKVYSLHAPEVECIGRGKARAPYEFGCKVSIATPVTAPKGGQFVLHAKTLPGNPYDGHTLGVVIEDTERLTGCEIERAYVDKGYRGHNYPNRFKVWISGQVRRVTKAIRREMRRRAAIEPVIGHLKEDHRMGRNYLTGRDGDRINAVLAAAGYNFSLLLRWFGELLRVLSLILWRALLATPLHLTRCRKTFFTAD